MTTKASAGPSAENFKQGSVTNKVMKILNLEFDKFEAVAKNCDRYTVIDTELPVCIVELFLRLFKLYVANPTLQQNMDSVVLFMEIFHLMKTHFEACPYGLDVDYDEDSDEENDDDLLGDCCDLDPMQRFLHYISLQQAQSNMSLEEATKKKLLKDVKHAVDWILEQNGILICEVCNSKLTNVPDIVAHSKLASHVKNIDILKANELYTAFPLYDIETFGCKACKSEYSTFCSLVKHFETSKHKDVVKELLLFGTKSNTNQNTPIQTGTKNPTNFEGKTNVMMKYKAKRVNNVETKSAGNALPKSQEKNTTSVTSEVETKSADNVSTKPRIKNTTTTSVASKAGTKPADNVLTKSQVKNITSVASKAETKPADNVSTKSQMKNTTSVASKTEKKSFTPAEKAPISETKPITKTTTKPENTMKFIVSKDSSGKYCQICDSKLLDEGAILAHAKASDHLKMISTFESNQEYVKTSINCDNLLCVLCGRHFCDIHKIACHFKEKQHVDKVKSSKSPPVVKNILKNSQLSDTDKKYFRQKDSVAQCIICDVTCNKIGDVIDHINGQQHSQNVSDYIQFEKYFELPSDKITSFNCLKCAVVSNTFPGIMNHCKDHVVPTPKPKPPEPFKMKKSDEKFISNGKTEKSSRCILCDKELPTEAALISHTGSSNHIKNSNVFTKNETYYVPGKTSCFLCENSFQDLASLIKHFKTDIHQKAAIKGKKPLNQTSIHIPSYSKSKLEQIVINSAPVKSPKLTTPKKDGKIEVTPRKSRLQLFSLSDANFDELTLREEFPMKRPDNSFIIAKNDVFYCRICDVDLPSITVASHMNGATHRINTELFENLQCHVLQTADCVECTLCKLTFEHVHQLVKHFREKLHGKPAAVEKPKAIDPPPPPPTVFVFGALENDEEEKQPPKEPIPVENNTENGTVLPKRVKIMKSDLKHIFRLDETTVQCNLCNTKLADNESLESHVNNLNHKRNSTVYQENEPLIKQLDSVGFMFECILCAFSGDLNKVIKHCKKKQHLVSKGYDDVTIEEKDVLDEDPDEVDFTITEFDLKCITMKNGIIRCKICHSKLTGEKNLLEHMNSYNHKKFAIFYKLNEPFIEQFDEFGFSYKCVICEVIFTRLDTMIKHFSDEDHVQKAEENQVRESRDDNARFNVTTYDFECTLCSITFAGFADFSKHSYSPLHEVLKNSIKSEQNEMPHHITITDYVYHCNACDIRLMNRALMEKHQKKRIHDESVTFFRKRRNDDPIIEIVGYEYLCNLCWFPMYSAAELAVHERSNMHKSGKNFDDVWSFNEKHLIMLDSMYKVRCKLCLKTIGIEKLIKHCTSRDHRMKFIANHLEESSRDRHIVWRNSTQYCTLCDCKLINHHNLVNHVNSEKHKIRSLRLRN